MYLALDLSVAPLQGQASFDGLVVFLESTGKLSQLGDLLCFYLIDPGI